MSKPKLLIVDDDESMCKFVGSGLDKRGFATEWRVDAPQAIEALTASDYDLVVTDLNLGDIDGLQLCRHVVANRPDTPVIVITAFGDMKTAIAALRAGAHDFINKPIEIEVLARAIQRALSDRDLLEEVTRLRQEVERRRSVDDLIGESAAIKAVHEVIRRVASTDASVLITGESGTGKELVARAIHERGDRAKKPFVAMNCAAVPANLLESELFGHVRGAFTDARTARKGLLAEADGGTLLLDEIGEMPIEMQPKLLRVLQEEEFRPVGADRSIAFDVRIIAATNRDLEGEVEEGRFREDLYYRLNVVEIPVPPLRARGNDILLLGQHFLTRIAEKVEKPVRGIAKDTARRLLEYDWPGNVRELENCIERAVTLTRFDQIVLEDLPAKIREFESKRVVLVDHDVENVLTLEELERRYIERVLEMVDENKSAAARLLGVDRRTLYRKLARADKTREPDAK